MSHIKKNKLINLILSSILLAILIAIWWLTTPNGQNSTAISDNAFPTVSCDFSTIQCVSIDNNRKVNLDITSNDISAFTPLTFEVSLTGFDSSIVNIDFQGIEMFMGANLLKLKKVAKNRFTGVIILPGHTGHGMTWRAITTITTSNNNQEEVWFEFPLQ